MTINVVILTNYVNYCEDLNGEQEAEEEGAVGEHEAAQVDHDDVVPDHDK